VDLDQEVDFIGKEALKKIKANGIKRKLVGLVMHSEPLAQVAQPWPIESSGQAIGEITSAIYSPDLEQNLAMGMVSIECSDEGTQVMVDMGEDKINATITAMPFIESRVVGRKA
jgi:aminomethyltransferase